MNRSPVAVILGAELRGWWNRLTKARPGRAVVLAILLLVATVIFGGFVFSGGVAAAQLLPESRDTMLAGAFTALSVLMLVLGFPTVIGNFFVGSDLLQLVLAPIRPLDIFVARALLAMRANVLLAGVVLAFLAGVGVGSGASALYYAAALVLLFVQVLVVTAAQVILMAVVLRFVPARIARDVAVAVAGVTGAGVYLLWNLTLRGSFVRRGTPDVSGLVSFANRIDWLPSAWPGHALSAVIDGDVGGALGWLALCLVLAAVLTAVAATLYGRTLLAGLGLLGATPTLWKRRPRAVPAAQPEAAGAASPELAIARKDWLAYRRDIRRLSRLLPGMLFLVAYAFVLVRPARGAGQFWTDVFLSAFISMFLAMAIATAAVPGERRGFQLLRMAPISTWEILRAKVFYTLSPVVALTVTLSVIVAATAGNGPAQVVEIALLAVWLGFGFVSVGVSAGAIDPHFESVDDRRAVGVGGTFAALGGELLFGVLSVGAFALLNFAVRTPSFLPSLPVTGPLLALIGISLAAAAAALVWGMLWLGAARLRAFEGAIGTAA
jgi:ABC-2 type transport system permease protein